MRAFSTNGTDFNVYSQAAKMYSLAACGECSPYNAVQTETEIYTVFPVMLFYDICLTFGDEVEKIWKRPFRGPTILWFAVSSITLIMLGKLALKSPKNRIGTLTL